MAGRTAALSPVALGCYIRLLTEYLRVQAPLPDEPRSLARITRVTRRAWPDIREELLDVFDLVDGKLVDEYAERCLTRFRATSERNRRNRGKRGVGTDPNIEDAS